MGAEPSGFAPNFLSSDIPAGGSAGWAGCAARGYLKTDDIGVVLKAFLTRIAKPLKRLT
jgi:hypothetical protein